MKTADVELWVLVDADGRHVACELADGLLPHYDEAFGRDDANPVPHRIIRVVLTVPLPSVPTLTGVVPADGDAVLTVA